MSSTLTAAHVIQESTNPPLQVSSKKDYDLSGLSSGCQRSFRRIRNWCGKCRLKDYEGYVPFDTKLILYKWRLFDHKEGRKMMSNRTFKWHIQQLKNADLIEVKRYNRKNGKRSIRLAIGQAENEKTVVQKIHENEFRKDAQNVQKLPNQQNINGVVQIYAKKPPSQVTNMPIQQYKSAPLNAENCPTDTYISKFLSFYPLRTVSFLRMPPPQNFKIAEFMKNDTEKTIVDLREQVRTLQTKLAGYEMNAPKVAQNTPSNNPYTKVPSTGPLPTNLFVAKNLIDAYRKETGVDWAYGGPNARAIQRRLKEGFTEKDLELLFKYRASRTRPRAPNMILGAGFENDLAMARKKVEIDEYTQLFVEFYQEIYKKEFKPNSYAFDDMIEIVSKLSKDKEMTVNGIKDALEEHFQLAIADPWRKEHLNIKLLNEQFNQIQNHTAHVNRKTTTKERHNPKNWNNARYDHINGGKSGIIDPADC